jgi:hypothetical protein
MNKRQGSEIRDQGSVPDGLRLNQSHLFNETRSLR